ncbi:MAG TPA: acetylglutamate kinase [Actinomycetota bacterium]|nr:acetylglutamate kinase [Actinomycetota bacterium]
MSRTAAAAAKAATLVEALPFIRSYRGRVVVVKLGGEPLDDPRLATVVAQDVALLSLVGIRVAVVHGGGPQISRAMEDRGVVPEFRDGLRVTGDAAMEIVQRTLVGDVNAHLVRRLNEAGAAAVGISGIDATTLEAEPVPGIGRVGTVAAVRTGLLTTLLEDGFTPVVAPVGMTRDATTLNVNADVAAAAVAGALRADKLVYLTNVPGLYRDLGDSASLVSEMKRDDLVALLPDLSDGMRPKMESALGALDAGVAKVHVLDGRVEHALLLEVFTPDGIGTQVLP